tara:strand:+ start:3201 stop:4364 length:1164 start_codon:yes stop_codon:yes gene_type:complete
MAAGLNFNFSKFFTRGFKKIGETVQDMDEKVATEAKAFAEDGIEKAEEYETQVEANRKLLEAEVSKLQALGIKDVGKIRTVMNAYGNEDVMKKLTEDYKSYRAKAALGQNQGKFTSLSEYINGKLQPQGILSDEGAEVAEDEAVIAGEATDIQKAEKRAKAMGVDLQTYLASQARKMSDKSAFDVDARAKLLVERSKLGLLGKTLTLEQAKEMITKDMGEQPDTTPKELGETGFKFDREDPLTAEEVIKIEKLGKQKDKDLGLELDDKEIRAVRNDLLRMIKGKGEFVVGADEGDLSIKDTPESYDALINEINIRLERDKQAKEKNQPSLSAKSINILNSLKAEAELKKKGLSKKQIVIPEIKSQEEYDKLPKGSQYKRNGKLYRKK